MISIALITLLTLFSPLIGMDKANTELRKEVKKKQIILNRLERENDRLRSNKNYFVDNISSNNIYTIQKVKQITLFNETSTFPKESIRNTDVYK